MCNILIVTHAFLPDLDGGIIVAYDYANLLVDLGHKVTVLSKEYKNPIQSTKFTYIQIPNKYGEYFWMYNYGTFLKNMDLDGFDLILLNQCPSAAIAGKYFSKEQLSRTVPIIQGVEVEWVYRNVDLKSNLFYNVFLRMKHYHRKCLMSCRKIVSVSDFHRQKVISAGDFQSISNKFQVIYTGIDKELFREIPSDFRKQIVAFDKDILLTVSRIEKMKGLAEMLSVYKRLIEKNDRYIWVIIGDGPYLQSLKEEVKIDFKDLKLEDVKGEVVIRDQSINLSDLCMSSNIGSGDLTMVYTTKTDQEATMGFELSLNDILVERLISLFPDIDTLVPMLRSFEGMVDCQMTATCKADSTMSVLLPSVNASCYLSGKNMVLLDGETFTEISKTLMFKNKKRNMIDSIAVDLAIHDNKIEVFPFLVEMDRYKVAVGGTHNLDMTFDYHLSVLKSPVPFKLGIDIKGNLDDFKFKIVKCKYKDFLKPTKQAELDSTRRNVREEIRETIRKQIREAAPELGNSLSEIHPHTHGHVEEST